MNTKIQIRDIQINGHREYGLTDTQSFLLSSEIEGPVKEICITVETRDGARCWTSGILPWQPNFLCEQLNLAPCEKYMVRVCFTGADCRAEQTLALYTGQMGRAWKAAWIEPEQQPAIKERPIAFFEQFVPAPDHLGGHGRLRPAQELRRVFSLSRIPQLALLCASAHGIYALWVNGRRADPRKLAPETSPYPSMLYYQVYDLTQFLVAGENTLRILLADGWWIGRIGITGDSCQYGDRLGFIGQLELDYGDGTRSTLLTDEQYQCRQSQIRYADLFMGEKWDLTLPEIPWGNCRRAAYGTDVLTLQTDEPVSVWNSLEPAAVLHTPGGELVVDFGQCLAGVVELHLNCPKGRAVTLEHSETLDEQGNFFRNILGRNKDQQDMVVCGDGETVFCPEFTYHGFRYVKIEGAEESEIRSVCARAMGTGLEKLGEFSCSDERLNQLQHNICWSTRSNMISVPTDCPQREKQGWTGDIQVFAPTGCFNYNLDGFLSAWLRQMRLEQMEDGGIPIIVPSYPAQTEIQMQTFGGNTSAAWSDACVFVPLELYRAYGDTRVLSDNFAMMERWMAFVERAASELPEDYEQRDERGKARCKYLWTSGFHFGDWLIPSYQNDVMGGTAVTGKVIASCEYAVLTAAFLEVLEALGQPEEKIEAYRRLLENIRNAVCEEYIHPDGTIDGDLQGMYVMALYSGAARGALAEKVAARLKEKIAENGGCLDTGFVSVPHLLDVLTDHGCKEDAWALLFQTKGPSWLYQVLHGATSIWENWNAILPDGTVTTSSFNHYALGCVGDWMYRHIGGLRRTGAGWKEIEFAPDLSCGLEWAKCSHRTPYGLAACAWKKDGSEVEVEVTVPHNVHAILCLPGSRQDLFAGTHRFRYSI